MAIQYATNCVFSEFIQFFQSRADILRGVSGVNGRDSVGKGFRQVRLHCGLGGNGDEAFINHFQRPSTAWNTPDKFFYSMEVFGMGKTYEE
jgi:hypothetical protein